MRRLLLLWPSLLAGGCQAASRPYAPVDNVRYSAIGQEPFWMVTIGDDAIVLASSPDPGAESPRRSWDRLLPDRAGSWPGK